MRDTAPPTGQNRPTSRLGRWWPLLAVGILLGVAAAAASLSQPRLTRLPPPEGGGSPPPLPSFAPRSLDPDDFSGGAGGTSVIPEAVTRVLMWLCLALVIAIAALVVWFMVRDSIKIRLGALPVEQGQEALRPAKEQVVAAVDAGLSDLSDTDRDPRRAVIACWVRLEQAAAAAGTPRQVGDTSTDLVVRLLSEQRVDRRVLDAFAAIYRAARYATHDVDEGMRAQAISALRQLRAELTAPMSSS
jgi:hypothetical protein